MNPQPDSPLSVETIRAHLTTRVLGSTLYVHDEMDSTNQRLADLAQAGAPDGTMVVAESQTAGRGRLGRQWVSPRGMNLYASILLLPRTQPSTAITWFPLLAAVAISRAIRDLAELPAMLKWPNDVIVLRDGIGRKLAGILVEAIGGQQPGGRAMVIGIGINVNMPIEAFPVELRSTATSLLIETGRPLARPRLLATVLGELERLCDELREHGSGGIVDAYQKLCDTIGKRVRVELVGSEPAEGTAELIASDGALRLRTNDGKTLEIRAGDVVHLR